MHSCLILTRGALCCGRAPRVTQFCPLARDRRMTPQLVSPGEMPAVSALDSIRGNAAFIAGPGLGGWIAVTFGPATAFALDAATYFLGIGALLMMRQKEFIGGEKGGLSWHTLSEGWRYALRRRDLLGTYLIDMNA